MEFLKGRNELEDKFFTKPAIYVSDVTINVMDINQSIAFYEKIIGFQLLEKTESEAVLTADGKTPLLTLTVPNNVLPKEERTTGLYHFAILLPTKADLGDFLNHVLANNIQIGAADHLVSEALYLNDPDGNGIEVYHDRPSSEWNWQGGEVAMATDPLDGNGLLAAGKGKWTGLPNRTVIGHIHLHVDDLERAKDFYVNGLGFKVATNLPGALFIASENYHHHIGLNVWNGAGAKTPLQNSVGLHMYRLMLPNESERQTIIRRLETQGATVTQRDDNVETIDPAGNKIQLVVSEK